MDLITTGDDGEEVERGKASHPAGWVMDVTGISTIYKEHLRR